MIKHLALFTLLLTLNVSIPRATATALMDQHPAKKGVPRDPYRRRVSFVGTVSDGDGKPVLGATVLLFDTVTKEDPATVTTNAQGQYEFTSLLPGDYEVWAKKGNEQSDHLTVKVDYGTASKGDLILRKAGARM